MNDTKTIFMESMLDNIDSISEQQHDAEFDVTIALCEQYIKYLDICENSNNPDVIVQEGKILDVATGKGNKDESIITKIVKFIPRLLGAIIKQIKSIFSKDKNKGNGFIDVSNILTDAEIDDIRKRRQSSPLYKAIIAAGCVGVGAAGAGLVFRIVDYTEAVEFKDDVSFSIAEDLSSIRITFPFYKIDGITKFNKEFSKLNTNSSDLVKFLPLFKYTVTNQARVSEKEFTVDTWNDYYENTITREFYQFSNNIEKLKNNVERAFSDKELNPKIEIPENELNKLLKHIETFTKKLPKDLELITKFNDKLIKVYNILAKPGEHSSLKVKKAAKFTFKPVMDEKEAIDIYNIDNHYLIEAIREFNAFIKELMGEKSDPHDKLGINLDYYKNRISSALGSLDVSGAAQTNQHYKNGCELINKQFNSSIDFRFATNGGQTLPDKAQKGLENVSFSKTKGFDLHGAKLIVFNDPNYVFSQVKDEVFGQMLCSIICHEIFHNIAKLSTLYKHNVINALKYVFDKKYTAKSTNELATDILTTFKNKLGINKTDDQKTMKRLCYVINNCNNDAKISSFNEKMKTNSDDAMLMDVDNDTSNNADVFAAKLSTFTASTTSVLLMMAVTTILLGYLGSVAGGITAFIALLIMVRGYNSAVMEKTNEETMCDMCAAMYKLPLYLTDVSDLKKNKGARDAASHGRYDVHSAAFDRQTVSLGLAKEMLNSGEKLEPEVRDYLEFIVNKNEGNQYAERKFTKQQMKKSAPAFTENINRAVTNFIKSHNIPLDE